MYKALITLTLASILTFITNGAKVFISIPEKIPIDVLSYSNEKSELPPQFSLLVWNTYKGKKETWSTDFVRLAKSHDLICLQEVYFTPAYLKTLKETKFNYSVGKTFSYLFGHFTGVATGSRFRPLKNQLYLGRYGEPFLGSPKGTLLSTFSLKGSNQKLLVLNIHGLNFVTWGFFANYLYGVSEKISQHRGPVIFAGDFNTWSKKKLSILYQTMDFYGLKKVPFEESNIKNVLGNPLDHIFVKGLEFNDFKVLELESSDHAALSVQLKLKN